MKFVTMQNVKQLRHWIDFDNACFHVFFCLTVYYDKNLGIPPCWLDHEDLEIRSGDVIRHVTCVMFLFYVRLLLFTLQIHQYIQYK